MLEGRRAVVTGGGSGIGRATCRRFADEGATVAVLDLDGAAAAAVASDVDGGMILHGAGIDGVLDYVMQVLEGEPPPG